MADFLKTLGRWSILTFFLLTMVMVFVWVVAGISYLDFWLPTSITKLMALVVAGLLVYFGARPTSRRAAVIALCLLGLALLVVFQTRSPRLDGNWIAGQQRLPQIELSKDGLAVEIREIRDFVYSDDGDMQENWRSKTFDLENIDSVWFGVDRFTEFEPIAHTFISFGFLSVEADGAPEFVAFSVEARRETTEDAYSPLRGVFSHYELHYVVATERDMLTQRSVGNCRPVQLYPMRAEKSRMQKMFRDIVMRIKTLKGEPEFYHTIRNNCTNNIVAHANHAGGADEQINMWQRDVIFPGYVDWLAHRYGLIDTDLPLAEAREQYRIDQRAAQWDGEQDFSQFIRQSAN